MLSNTSSNRVSNFKIVSKRCNSCNHKFKVDTLSHANTILHIASKKHQRTLRHEKEHRYGYKMPKIGKLNAIARILLMGVYDDTNILSKLRGMSFIVKQIWQLAYTDWSQYIKTNGTYFTEIENNIYFPAATNININMMP
eukprot:10959_1